VREKAELDLQYYRNQLEKANQKIMQWYQTGLPPVNGG
jgi:5-bromo-4-chloroindolyl phosphate hydrolysis protein